MNAEASQTEEATPESVSPFSCPVCGEECEEQRCKVVCRSRVCVYRVIANCSEF